MSPAVLLLTLAAGGPTSEPQTALWQVAPGTTVRAWAATDKPASTRALVLVPGLHLHPLRPIRATRPEITYWQLPKSDLVKALAKDFDVFAFGYAQTVSVDEVAKSAGLRDAVAGLRATGYTEVVLVGHSAGGVISRQFAEQNPDAGVTRVVAVAAPFAGAEMATINVGVPKGQAPFVKSLAPEARKDAVRLNLTPLGKDVEFACVVCKMKRLESDGVVRLHSQWPEDLQALGVPSVLAVSSHIDAMEDPDSLKAICTLASGKITRWSPDEVTAARKVLFGETPTRARK